MDKKILLIGGSGYLCSELVNSLGKNQVLRTYKSRKIKDGIFFDLESTSIIDIIRTYPKINKVIIAAGLFNFTVIGKNPELAYYYNVECTKKLLDEIHQVSLFPVFISSESVFDGKKGYYVETDLTNPRFEYARHKDIVEKYIFQKLKTYQILRCSKIFDSDLSGNTLVANWIKKLQNNENIYCADDNIFSPIHLGDLCELTTRLLAKDLTGVFHLSGPLALNRKDMLDIVVSNYKKCAQYTGNIIYKGLNEFEGAENQPLDTSLNPNKAILSTGFKPENFEYWVKNIMKDFNRRIK